MRYHQHHLLVSLLIAVLCLTSSSLCSSSEEDERVCDEHGTCRVVRREQRRHGGPRKEIAIIGGGIAGSSAAYYISQLLPNAEITIYEKESHVCGRVQDTIINGRNVEVGGSVYHESNANVDGFVHQFNLTRQAPFGGSTVGIWNGKEFVFRGSDVPVVGGLVNLVKMFYRYGWAPYNLKNYLDSLMGNWSKLYTMNEPFDTVDQFFDRLGLKDDATSLAPAFLENLGISRQFTKEILGSMTRVNYNTDVEIMNSFGVAVSAIGSGDDIYSVKEGNKKICSNLVNAAKAISKYGHKVTSVTREYSTETKYTVATSTSSDTFDAVVIAVPLELAPITFNNIEVDEFVFHARQYQKVHVTFVGGELNSNYFHTLNDSAPSVILTVESPSIPFSSIGRSKNITLPDGSPVSKVFSRTPLTDETIQNVFINGSVIFEKVIHAYPILRPPRQFVAINLDGERMYYVNAMESVISTIETQTISAKNIARLLAKSWGHPHTQKL